MKICAVTCTAGRHACLERVVRFFLDQTYDNCIQLIYQNSSGHQRLNNNIPKNKILLVNNSIDLQTKKRYDNTGAIFRDAITYVPDDIDAVTFLDDDDIFLPNHIEEGVRGLHRAFLINKQGYKPKQSYYKQKHSITKASNNMEPSVFVKLDYIKKMGFRQTTVDYHQAWLINDNMFIDPDGVPTLVYDWSGQMGVHKLSGGRNDEKNFSDHIKYSKDHGDGIITPMSREEAKKYYVTG